LEFDRGGRAVGKEGKRNAARGRGKDVITWCEGGEKTGKTPKGRELFLLRGSEKKSQGEPGKKDEKRDAKREGELARGVE